MEQGDERMTVGSIRSGYREIFGSVRCASLVWPLAFVAQVDAHDPEAARTARAMGFVLVAILLLAIFFLLGSLIFVRSARRYRAGVERRSREAQPTASADVWSMHKAPPDTDAPSSSDRPDEE